MKAITVKLDNFVLDLISAEAKEKKMTRMELIRSAIINFLVNRDDAADLAYIREHKKDKLLSFEQVFGHKT